ncbi:MAG: bifunctional homocysteine S-methyltransferase/methylenetetrahydrofolate reductase, partial [Acidobacteria bacterium]|nr:bifunctional homocysteine S-methyltransferase/methylenetetrahydrofolate reductase [Acidobacteriota bacterium]
MASFLDVIQDRVLVCDGAMGTMLYSKGVFINRCFDALNLTQSDLVAEVHQAYVRGGADVIETNTFGANRVKLGSFGQAERLHAINVRGAQIARHAARDRVFVAGAMGPLGIRIEPWGKTGVDEARDYFTEQVAALLEGGVDLFILETFRDLNEIGAAIAAVRSLTDLPIVAQMTTEEDGNSLDGTPPETFAPELERLGAQVIGVNCSVGPAPMLETIDRISRVTSARLSAQPNAGAPRSVEGRYIYLSSPEYMASYARRFIAKGVRLVGGCCGTTPEHIRQIKQSVRAMTPGVARASTTAPAAPAVDRPTSAPTPVTRPEKSRFAHAIARGHFVTAVELLPPRGHEVGKTIEQARLLKIHGVDAVNVPDASQSSTRMSALSTAVLVEHQAGIETVLHYTCRERSLLAMQSDLLGAHAMGLRNVLIRTGIPRKAADYPEVAPPFDVDSIGLTNVVARLNRGYDVGGQEIGEPTAFHIGVVANPGAENLDEEVRRFEYKVEAGAEFAITYPIFDVDALEAFLTRIEPVRIPIVAAVLPFESLLHAEFLANEVPGVRVPEPLVA